MSSASFVVALETEITSLEGRLSLIPDFKRWIELTGIRELYAHDDASFKVYTEPKREPSRPPGQESGKRRSRHADTVELIRGFLSDGRAMTTQEIVDWLSVVGIMIGGKDPRNSMRSILLNAGIFESHGREGWLLKAEHATLPALNAPSESGGHDVSGVV